MVEQRRVVVVTSMGKKFRGMVDIPNNSLRTTDLFNSASVFWNNPGDKCLENAVLLHDVQLVLDKNSVCFTFDKLQVKLSEVIYFYDDHDTLGDEKEKMRASAMAHKTKEVAQRVTIVTTEVSNSFFKLSGIFFGLFKKKSTDKFIPLTDAVITEIYKKEGKWFQREVELPHSFICMSTSHIEAMTIC